LYKKFNLSFIKDLYTYINYENKLELDIKMLTKGINLYFKRKYIYKDLYKIFSRIGSSITKINFIYYFSK
jgi:hypothetical protein